MKSAFRNPALLLSVLGLVLSLGLLAGCGGDDGDDTTAGAGDTAPLASEDFVGMWVPADGTENIELELLADGSVAGSDGCNRLVGGGWEVEAGDDDDPAEISIDDVGTTMMACVDATVWPLGAEDMPIDGDELIVQGENDAEVGRLVRDAG